MKVRVAFVIGDYPPEERKRREDVALSYSSAEVEVGIVSAGVMPYIQGVKPTEIQLAAPYFIQAFRQAEKEGYDAVVPLGMLEIGVDGGKSAVDIPIIGPTESCLHVAALLGDRFGMIVYHPTAIPVSRAIVRRYGMESWIAGIRSVGFYVTDLAANRDQMVENFIAEARALIKENGAEVIIPFGISQCPVYIKPDWLSRELGGVPVVEGIGAPIRMAAMLASMGLRQSRIRWPKSTTLK